MNAFCKAVHGLALCLLLGGPLFWTCIWRGLDALEARQATLQVWYRVRLGTWFGAVGFLLSGAADVLRVAHQVIDPMDLEILLQFLIGTRYGNMMLLKSGLIPIYLTSMFLLSTSGAATLATTCTFVAAVSNWPP